MLKYLFFSGLGAFLFFVPVFLLFRSSLFFFVLLVVFLLLSLLGRRLLGSIVLLRHEKRHLTLGEQEGKNGVHSKIKSTAALNKILDVFAKRCTCFC